MLQAYIDASGKGDPNLLVMAGFVATPAAWQQFSDEWRSRLQDAKIPYFKMNKMSRKPPEIIGWFYRAIEEADIKALTGVVINTKELVEVERSIIWPIHLKEREIGENPYYWGLKYIVGLLAAEQEKIGLTERVDFIFDEEAEKTRIPRAWPILTQTAAPAIGQYLGKQPVYADDKEFPQLQAADLVAWWFRKWQREGVADWADTLPFPWEPKRRMPRIVGYFGRKSFLHDTSKTLEYLATDDKGRAYARSLMPEEWRE